MYIGLLYFRSSASKCTCMCHIMLCTLCEVELMGTVGGVYVWTNGVQVYKASEACW